MPIFTSDVLIAGGGPAGMSLALALAQFGVKTIIAERREQTHPAPRAHALNARSLEILAGLGLDITALRRRGSPDKESGRVHFVETLAGGLFGSLPYERIPDQTPYPSPHKIFNIAQPETEAALAALVAQKQEIDVRHGLNWRDSVEANGFVVSRLEQGGSEVKIKSRFLAGADGAGSTVRRAHHIPMEGLGALGRFKNVHFRADLSQSVRGREGILYWIINQNCPGTFIAHNIRDNWVFMHMTDAKSERKGLYTHDYWQATLRRAIGSDAVEIEILDVGDWVMSSDIARRWRRGRAFLLGDAAHRFPPSGGLGLNSGIGDAHNLGWKLAAVLQGWAGATLLNSYETERKPVIRHNAAFSVNNSAKMMTLLAAAGVFAKAGRQPSFAALKGDKAKWAELQDHIEQQRDHFDGLALHIGAHYGHKTAPDLHAKELQSGEAGARLPHAWLDKEKTRSTLGLLAPGAYTLIASPEAGIKEVKSAAPVQLRIDGQGFELSQAWRSLCNLSGAWSMLVRPDGHIERVFYNASAEDVASYLHARLHEDYPPPKNRLGAQLGRAIGFRFARVIMALITPGQLYKIQTLFKRKP